MEGTLGRWEEKNESTPSWIKNKMKVKVKGTAQCHINVQIFTKKLPHSARTWILNPSCALIRARVGSLITDMKKHPSSLAALAENF